MITGLKQLPDSFFYNKVFLFCLNHLMILATPGETAYILSLTDCANLLILYIFSHNKY